jgi:creatinine amidohydrolase
MTQIFAYENLTWPEIDELPRDTPLIIPLGEGYSARTITSSLNNFNLIGMLPPIPFGWSGSGLPVDDTLLVAMLTNLIDSLKDDGFTCVYILKPFGLDLKLDITHLALPKKIRNKSVSLFPGDSEQEKVVIIPIGHTEQHGYHLPMSTDSLIISAIGKGIVSASPKTATCLPTMPYGVSTHRASFVGTLNCGGRPFEDFWLGVIGTLSERRFDKIYIISGHGGNISHLVNVVKYAGDRYKHLFCATSWLYLSGPGGISAINAYRKSDIGGMGHACELETSLILHLNPDLVRMERVVDEVDFIATPSYYMDWVEGGALIANPPWDDDTVTGAYGAGSLATSENGKRWLDAAIEEKVTHVVEIQEQHRRRMERRSTGYGLWGKSYRA